MSMRLDKYLSDYTELTRSQAKKAIRAGRVTINGAVSGKGEERVEDSDVVVFDGEQIRAQKYQYLMLNKPAGLISATKDDADKTVVEYLKEKAPAGQGASDDGEIFLAKDLFPVGRLDKDTEGLLILTNDGDMAHRLLSPKRHVDKTYFVRLDTRIDETDRIRMRKGLDIGEKRETRPAELEILSETEAYLTITEGKFHQVKRMFAKLGKKVVYLKRVRMGKLELDESLMVGDWRFLTEEEIRALRQSTMLNQGSC